MIKTKQINKVQEEINYPCLMEYQGNTGGVILLTKPGIGMVVDTGSDNLFNHLGYYSTSWNTNDRDKYKPLRTTLQLTNGKNT